MHYKNIGKIDEGYTGIDAKYCPVRDTYLSYEVICTACIERECERGVKRDTRIL